MYYCLFEVFKDWLKITWFWSVLLTWTPSVAGSWLTEQAEQWGQCLCSFSSLQCVCQPSRESRSCPFIPALPIPSLLADRSAPVILRITQPQFLRDKKILIMTSQSQSIWDQIALEWLVENEGREEVGGRWSDHRKYFNLHSYQQISSLCSACPPRSQVYSNTSLRVRNQNVPPTYVCTCT